MDNDTRESLRRKQKMLFTRKLRRIMTTEETILWELLRDRRFHGVKFRRQINIGPYIVDFLSKQFRIVIEVDGKIHSLKDQKDHDENRDAYLRELGYNILRIRNEDIHQNIQLTLSNIHRFIDTYKTVPSPPQRRGLG